MGLKKYFLIIVFFVLLLTALHNANIYLLVAFAILLWFLLPQRKYWDTIAGNLMLFSFLYFLIILLTSQSRSGFVLIAYLIAPVAFYRFGRWLMSCFLDDAARQKMILLIMLVYLLPLFILTIEDITVVGIVNIDRELSGNTVVPEALAATLYGLMASIGIAGISNLFVKGQPLWLRCGFILVALFSLLVNLHLINRTGLVIFCIVSLVSCIYVFRAQKLNIISLFLILLVPVVLLTQLNTFSGEISEAYINRGTLSEDGNISAGGRVILWLDAIDKMFIYPFGWHRLPYAHNLWLDIARVGGLLTLIPFIIVSFIYFRTALRLISIKSQRLCILLLGVNMSMALACFVEPVIEGSMLYFSLYMTVWGMTIQVIQEKNQH